MSKAIERNTEGLKRNAEKKRLETEKKVNRAITDMLKVGSPISFSTVAREAGVSKATLYNNSILRERIDTLKVKKQSEMDIKLMETISELRDKVKKLELDKELLIAQLYEQELIRKENEELKKRLSDCTISLATK